MRAIGSSPRRALRARASAGSASPVEDRPTTATRESRQASSGLAREQIKKTGERRFRARNSDRYAAPPIAVQGAQESKRRATRSTTGLPVPANGAVCTTSDPPWPKGAAKLPLLNYPYGALSYEDIQKMRLKQSQNSPSERPLRKV